MSISDTSTTDDLLKRFQSDFLYDCHQTHTKWSRSQARKILISRGIEILDEVCTFAGMSLAKHGSAEMNMVWSLLIHEIVKTKDPKVPFAADDYSDGSVWIAWARREHLEKT